MVAAGTGKHESPFRDAGLPWPAHPISGTRRSSTALAVWCVAPPAPPAGRMTSTPSPIPTGATISRPICSIARASAARRTTSRGWRHDARAGRLPSRRLQGRRERASHAIRSFRGLRPDAQFPADPAGGHQAGDRDRCRDGLAVKPSGARKLQPVANRFFYWLRASTLETRRRRQLVGRPYGRDRSGRSRRRWRCSGTATSPPARTRCATTARCWAQLALFQRHATGNFRELLIAVARGPGDARVPRRRAEREGRAQREFRPRGDGVVHHGRRQLHRAGHPRGGPRLHRLARRRSRFRSIRPSTTTGRRPFSAAPASSTACRSSTSSWSRRSRRTTSPASSTASWCARICRRPFRRRLGALLRDNKYEIAPFLRTVFLSRDFYSARSVGTHIKGPVELIVSTYRRLGLKRCRACRISTRRAASWGRCCSIRRPWPDGRRAARGSRLGTLLARGNFARDVLFPDMIDFVDPNFSPTRRSGRSTAASSAAWTSASHHRARARRQAAEHGRQAGGRRWPTLPSDQEDFNTHYASLKGWEEAVRKVKPIPRAAAQFSLTRMVFAERREDHGGCGRSALRRFLRVPIDDEVRATTDRVPREAARHQRSRACAELFGANRCGWSCT